MKNKRRITGIVAALILAFIGTAALMGYVNSAKDRAVADEARRRLCRRQTRAKGR